MSDTPDDGEAPMIDDTAIQTIPFGRPAAEPAEFPDVPTGTRRDMRFHDVCRRCWAVQSEVARAKQAAHSFSVTRTANWLASYRSSVLSALDLVDEVLAQIDGTIAFLLGQLYRANEQADDDGINRVRAMLATMDRKRSELKQATAELYEMLGIARRATTDDEESASTFTKHGH